MAPAAARAAAPVVDDLVAVPAAVAPGGVVTLSVDAHDPDCADNCTTGCGLTIRADLTLWSATGGSFIAEDDGTTGSPYTATANWQAPATEDTYTITVSLADSGSFICGGRQSTTASIDILVTSNPNLPPVVDSLTAVPSLLLPQEAANLLCVATDPDEDPVTYDWAAEIGAVTPGAAGTATYTAPTDVVGLDTITCTADDGTAQGSDTVRIAVVGAEGEKSLVKELVAPQRLGADSEGNLYVVDRGAINVVNLFSEELVYRIPVAGVTSVAVDWNDNLLIGGRLGVALWNRSGALLLPLSPGGNPGDVADVAVDLVNERYAALYRGSGKVAVFDAAGAPVLTFGSTGDAPDQLRSPQGLAADPAGDWLVADSGHGLIKRFDAAGNLLAAFGGLGGGVGEFVQLDDVEVDGNGLIYASDGFQSWVQVFDPDGTMREVLGGHGDEVGQFKTPTGIVEVAGVSGLGDFDRLVVASLNNSSLQVFRRDRDPLVGPPPSAEAAVTPATLTFADTAVGQIGSGLTVSLSNIGSAILGVHSVTTSGPFVAEHSCPALEPGESCSIAVAFEPQAPGQQSGGLSIETSSGPLAVSLGGQALLSAEVELTPARLGFNDQEIGTVSDPRLLTLTNTGTVALQIFTVVASAEYLVGHDCPVTLPGGAGCAIEVRFAPVSVIDNLLGTVTVISSAAGSPHVVNMEGSGIPVIPRFTVRSLEPDGIEEGDGSPVHARFEITLSPAPTLPASVHYEVVTGTAAPGEDFEPAAGQLEFAAGETRKILSVPVIGDEILEPDAETLVVDLWGPLAALIEDGSAETSVLDDEVCLGPVLLANAGAETLNGESWIPAWTESAGAGWAIRSQSPEPHEGIGYLVAAPSEFAELTQEVEVSEFADAIDAGRQLLEFSARLRTAEDDTARILIEYRNLDKTVVLDRFDSGEISSPGVWQEVADLRAAPPDTRWVQVRLLGRRLTGVENDAFFDALSLRSIRAATLDVADFSAYEGSDGLASAVLSVKLACPYYEDVFVDLATADGTATAGQDYQATVTTVSLPTGETEDQVVIDLFGDLYDEGHEEFFVDVDGITAVGAVPLTDRAVGVILDDDSCPLRPSAWAANADLLPLRLALGGEVYETGALVGFLGYNGNDLSLEVARGLTAARLNLQMGSDPYILSDAAAADAYLAAYPPGSRPDPNGDGGPAGRHLRDDLRRYNKPRACSLGPPVR